jgi:hypothetical protein
MQSTDLLERRPLGLPNVGALAKGFFVVRITGDRIIAAYRIREAAGWKWKFPMDRPLALPVAK